MTDDRSPELGSMLEGLYCPSPFLCIPAGIHAITSNGGEPFGIRALPRFKTFSKPKIDRLSMPLLDLKRVSTCAVS